MTYKFRIGWELLWAFLIAVLTPVISELVTFDFSTLQDPGTWGLALLGASIRAGAGFILALFGGQILSGDKVLYDNSKEG